jgi:trans-aconitate methyltransferase
MKKENGYTWNAEDYAKHSSVQQDWARELISKLKLEGYESVLDIGCGDGKTTAEIANQLSDGNILGVDSSNDMIELACQNYPHGKHPNLGFKLVDAKHLPFKEQFDIVFSNAALHWIKDHKPVILGIKNSLKPNGRILLQMGGEGNAESIISLLETIIAEKEWKQYFSGFEFPYGFYDPETYELWLKEAALSPIRVELIPKDMSYKDKDGLAAWIRTTWLPYTDRVPTHQRKEFITQFVEKYIDKFPFDSKGNVHVKMIRLEVEAIKDA